MQNSIVFVENLLDQWPKYEFTESLNEKFSKMSTDENGQQVKNKLEDGRDNVLCVVRYILKNKSKYLKTLVQ